MAIDNDKIFGTTREARETESGNKRLYIWMVDLDLSIPNHWSYGDLIVSTFKIF